nr:Uncharacterised protein [Salmonella sp. NCTC 7297]
MSILAQIIMKSATVVAYSMGLSEELNHWVTLSSRILNYVSEPGVSQEGYRAPDVRLPEQLSLIGKSRAQYPVVTHCHVFGVHRSSYKYWEKSPEKPDGKWAA